MWEACPGGMAVVSHQCFLSHEEGHASAGWLTAIQRAACNSCRGGEDNSPQGVRAKKQRGEVPSKLPAFLTALFKFFDFREFVLGFARKNRASRVLALHSSDVLLVRSRRIAKVHGRWRAVSLPCTLCQKAARQGPLKASSFPYRAAEFSFSRLIPGPCVSANWSPPAPGTLKHRSHTDGVKIKFSKWGK